MLRLLLAVFLPVLRLLLPVLRLLLPVLRRLLGGRLLPDEWRLPLRVGGRLLRMRLPGRRLRSFLSGPVRIWRLTHGNPHFLCGWLPGGLYDKDLRMQHPGAVIVREPLSAGKADSAE